MSTTNSNEPLFDMNIVFVELAKLAKLSKEEECVVGKGGKYFNELLGEISALKNSSSDPDPDPDSDLLKGQIRELLESGDISAPRLKKFCTEVTN